MVTEKDILKLLETKSADEIAKEFTDNLNAAIATKEKAEQEKKEKEAKAKEKQRDLDSLADHFNAFMHLYYPEYETDMDSKALEKAFDAGIKRKNEAEKLVKDIDNLGKLWDKYFGTTTTKF